MINIIPFGDQILIEPFEKKQVLVSEQRSLSKYGKVIAIGEDVQKVKVGDMIAFIDWGMNSVDINEKKLYFVRED